MFNRTKKAGWLPLDIATLFAVSFQPNCFFRNAAISVRNS